MKYFCYYGSNEGFNGGFGSKSIPIANLSNPLKRTLSIANLKSWVIRLDNYSFATICLNQISSTHVWLYYNAGSATSCNMGVYLYFEEN